MIYVGILLPIYTQGELLYTVFVLQLNVKALWTFGKEQKLGRNTKP